MKVRFNQGFTLIEVMVVVLIIGILGVIATTSYHDSVVKTRRSEAPVALERAAQGLERCYTRFSTYDNASCNVAVALEGDGLASDEGWYLVTGEVEAATYALTATPQRAQANDDPHCANFTYNNAGTRGVSGDFAVNDCW